MTKQKMGIYTVSTTNDVGESWFKMFLDGEKGDVVKAIESMVSIGWNLLSSEFKNEFGFAELSKRRGLKGMIS